MAPPPSSKKNGKRKADAVLDIDTPASPPAPASTGKDPQRPNPRIGHASDAEAGPSTSARASKKTRLSDKDQLANVTRKLQETEALLKSARDEANRYRKYKQKYCQDKSTRASKLIPRPDGERGKNGWTIRGALQLEDNGDLYLTILASVRDAITAAGLDWRQTFPRQEPSRLTDCYRLIKEQNPYLKRFEGDWPARELVISALQNKRKTRGRKRRREVQQDIGDGGGGDGELNSGDESEGLSDQDEE